MNKYNDIEIQTAKNLLKKGFKWIVRQTYGGLYAYKDKPHKNYDRNYIDDVWKYDGDYLIICTIQVPIFQSVTCDDTEPTSLERIVNPQILDDVERKYLKFVFKPFAKRIEYVKKTGWDNKYYISVILSDNDSMDFPNLNGENMYKGMEIGKRYTLEELGL